MECNVVRKRIMVFSGLNVLNCLEHNYERINLEAGDEILTQAHWADVAGHELWIKEVEKCWNHW